MNQAGEEVRLLFEGVAPERKEQIEILFKKTGVVFERVSDRKGFYIQTLDRVVLFNDRSLQQIYLTAFMSWKALAEQSGAILVFGLRKQPYDEERVRRDRQQHKFQEPVDELARAIATLRDAESIENFEWPKKVPKPIGESPKFEDAEDRLAFELALFGLAYILLHETRHAIFAVEENSPGGIAEELACDAYAADFLLGKIHAYVELTGEPAEKILTKRALGLLVAQATILELTPEHRWNSVGEHPRIPERIMTAFQMMEVPVHDPAWMYASSMMLARLRRSGRSIGQISFSDPQDLCFKVARLFG